MSLMPFRDIFVANGFGPDISQLGRCFLPRHLLFSPLDTMRTSLQEGLTPV